MVEAAYLTVLGYYGDGLLDVEGEDVVGGDEYEDGLLDVEGEDVVGGDEYVDCGRR
jgi:hypothetical protein